MFRLCSRSVSAWRPYVLTWFFRPRTELEAIGMADVMFLATGGAAFLAFAVLAVFLKRV